MTSFASKTCEVVLLEGARRAKNHGGDDRLSSGAGIFEERNHLGNLLRNLPARDCGQLHCLGAGQFDPRRRCLVKLAGAGISLFGLAERRQLPIRQFNAGGQLRPGDHWLDARRIDGRGPRRDGWHQNDTRCLRRLHGGRSLHWRRQSGWRRDGRLPFQQPSQFILPSRRSGLRSWPRRVGPRHRARRDLLLVLRPAEQRGEQINDQ